MIPADRVYLDPGDRLAGRYDPPRRCRVLIQWRPGGRPQNVLVEYADDGSRAVIPFSRRLKRAPERNHDDMSQPTSVVLDVPLHCYGQMMNAYAYAADLGVPVHQTSKALGRPDRKHPTMGSSCMPHTPTGSQTCRHDVGALRIAGAQFIGDDFPCWSHCNHDHQED